MTTQRRLFLGLMACAALAGSIKIMTSRSLEKVPESSPGDRDDLVQVWRRPAPLPRFVEPYPEANATDAVEAVWERPDVPADQVLEAFRAEACACLDKDCFQKVTARYQGRVEATRDEVDVAVATGIASAVADCVEKLPVHRAI